MSRYQAERLRTISASRTCRALLAAFLVFSAAASAVRAEPITFNIINPTGNQSRIDLSATGMLLGGALTVNPQHAPGGLNGQGSLSTLYTGTIETILTQTSLNLPGASEAAASNTVNALNNPLQLSPSIGGTTGTDPGDYGLRLIAPVAIDLPPIDIPDLGTVELGTLTAVNANIALRDVVLDLTSPGALSLNPGFTLPQTFDASSADITIAGTADVSLTASLLQDNVGTFIINLALIQALASSAPELNLTVTTGPGLTINIGFGTSFEIPATTVQNSGAGLGLLEQVGPTFRLTTPIDFQVVPELDGLEDIFELELGLSGQLVAEAPFQVLVPEPASFVFAGIALVGGAAFVARRRRRTRASAA